jgi:type II secretory pathway component GspD/PulD (secretin)
MTRASSSKKRQPPSFHHYPPNRAKELKKAWVQRAKIKSKWKNEKRKAGLLPSQPSMAAEAASAENKEASGPTPCSEPVVQQPPERAQPHNSSLRQLTKNAYSPSSLHTHKSTKHRASQADHGERKGQPSMKLRMNALLAKIQQDCV